MCRKFVLVSNLDKIEGRFHVHLNQHTLPITESYCVNNGDSTYVITSENPYELQVFKFGMTPYFSKEPQRIINARAEGYKNLDDDPYYCGSNSIFLRKEFKKPIQSQRCLVIADAYYEWSSDNKPYLVFLQNKERPFGFAGVYDRWKNLDTGEILASFAIVTTTANDLLLGIGVKRMPVILSKSRETSWIKSTKPLSDVLQMLNPFPEDQMNAFPVSDLVNESGINEVAMIKPTGDKLQIEVEPTTRIVRPYRMHKEKPHSDTPWFESRK